MQIEREMCGGVKKLSGESNINFTSYDYSSDRL